MSDSEAVIISPDNARRERSGMQDYGIHESEDGMLTWSWVSAEMAKSRNYWICTTRPNGNPHAVPVWGIWMNETLYFGSSRSSRKSRNVTHNAQTVVHLESGDDTVILEGILLELNDDALLKRINQAYKEKYPPYDPTQSDPDPGTVMYHLKPQKVMAWLETDFPRTAARWIFEA